ncbi:CMRF35-like molecule 6 isoform X2 [Chelmon rostratus]|uniref:CMRF35-like molecule 6 isoform X2 n=1 Tax=Chelmon rostratus TaxID=109905 RepID=UPI001BE93FDA|nr:CMRF35-like molecule 6 isoform X2 [Chelmon rostratus]
MKVRHALIGFLFFTLWDANTVFSAETSVLTAKEGGNFTHGCQFSLPLFGKTKTFCRSTCREEDVLIQTTDDAARRGRYSIQYTPGAFASVLDVSITELTKSDAGRYRCGLNRKWLQSLKEDFEIRVEDAPVESKPTSTAGALSPSVPSASGPTTAPSLSSSSGSSTPSSASPEASEQPEQQQTPAAASGSGVLLHVGLTLLAMIGVLSAAVLIICRKRASKPKGLSERPLETEHTDVTGANRVYEEVQEESRQRRPPPDQTSTVYSYAKFSKPNAAAASDEHGCAAAASPHKTAEDESSKLTYSQVFFRSGASLNSTPCGDAENGVCSTPRGGEAPPPLYSTLAFHQL